MLGGLPLGSARAVARGALRLHPALAEQSLVSWLEPQATAAAFADHWRGSPVRRPGRAGLARNAAIVLGNRPDEPGREALLRALSFDPEPLVREAAAWGLLKGHASDAGVRTRVAQAAQAESEDEARAAMTRSLDELGG